MFVDISWTNRKYNIIYADPPWSYNSRMALGKGAKRSSPEDYYPVMTLDEICALPIQKLAAKDCVLFLWATHPKIKEALQVIEKWGFTHKSTAFVWVKRNKVYNAKRAQKNDGLDDYMGQGRWTRANSEIVLIATKGNPKRVSAKVRQIVFSPIRKHSQKPDKVYSLIEELLGKLPRIELFARQQWHGWDVWGNDISINPEMWERMLYEEGKWDRPSQRVTKGALCCGGWPVHYLDSAYNQLHH